MTNDMPENSPTPASAPRRRIPLSIAAVLIGAAAGFAGIYGFGSLHHEAGDPSCRGAVDLAKKIAAPVCGEVAALSLPSAPLKVPDLTCEDADGKRRQLSDWRGKTVLVNLWAPWC